MTYTSAVSAVILSSCSPAALSIFSGRPLFCLTGSCGRSSPLPGVLLLGGGEGTRPRIRSSFIIRNKYSMQQAAAGAHDGDDYHLPINCGSLKSHAEPTQSPDLLSIHNTPDPDDMIVRDPTFMSKRQFLSSLLLLASISPAAAGNFWGSNLLAATAATADSIEQYNAEDDNGKPIVASQWVKTHPVGDRTIAKGYPEGPIYLVVEKDGALANYGINAICTHMGCVVPWVPEEEKFMCPCHGSQYDNRGQVVQGPAPLSLPLVHVNTVNEKVVFSPWLETDFRDGEAPWWAED